MGTVGSVSRIWIVAAAIAVAYVIAWPVNIEPAAWTAPPARPPVGALAVNDELASCEILATLPGKGPDSLAIDAIGYLYTGLGDGRILRISPDGSRISELAHFDGRATGVAFDIDGNLLVADERGGAVYVLADDGTLVPLMRDLDGEPLLLVNDLAVGNDGTVYVTESSTRFSIEQLRFEILEHRPNGRILAYDPTARSTRVLLDDLYFPNGIALSKKQDSIFYAETTAYRVSRYWLRGPRAGTVDTVVDALPGFPGDVSVSDSGRVWTSLLAPRNRFLDRLASWPQARAMLARLPRSLFPAPTPFPYLIAFDEKGRIERSLQTTSRRDLPSFSSVVESAGFLYLGTPGIDSPLDADAVYRVRL